MTVTKKVIQIFKKMDCFLNLFKTLIMLQKVNLILIKWMKIVIRIAIILNLLNPFKTLIILIKLMKIVIRIAIKIIL